MGGAIPATVVSILALSWIAFQPFVLGQEDRALDDEFSTLDEDDFPDLVSADEKSELIEELEFLEESGTIEVAARHAQAIGMSPSAITVITRQEIETSGATNLVDLLRLVPGTDIVLMAPLFSSVTGRRFWTFENNTHLVLVNGREANLEVLGSTPWILLPLSLNEIERIEVIRGPGSALYGSNALLGVVSITTRPQAERAAGLAFVEAGEAGTLLLGARGSGQLGGLGLQIGGEVDRANLWTNTREPGKRVWKLHAEAHYPLPKSAEILVDAGLSNCRGLVSSASGRIGAAVTLGTLLVAYRSEELRGRLYWNIARALGQMQAELAYSGIPLATFVPIVIDGNTIDGEIQWSVPLPWDWLTAIVGGGGRITATRSLDLLQAETFANPESPAYHQAGFSDLELLGSAFVHAEITPVEWLTNTVGLRFDASDKTGGILSPRLAGVFRLATGHFLRLGVARSFRRPGFWEAGLHPDVSFPDGSPFVGTARDTFREFMTHMIGNARLESEKVWAFEAGYRVQFLDDRLNLGLELFHNVFQDKIVLVSNIVPHPQFLIDLDQSSFQFQTDTRDINTSGGELSIRLDLSRSVGFLASWSFRDSEPRNLVMAGGHFRSERGLLGSLYVHTRSEFVNVVNRGLLAPFEMKHMESVALIMARLGYGWSSRTLGEMEVGLKLFLPVSPFSAPYFRTYEMPGGKTVFGQSYGGEELARVISLYWTGRF